jgi:hypothetical protein
MKFITSASLSLLLGIANAHPAALVDRAEPSNSPIDVGNLSVTDSKQSKLTLSL